jgi:hypothetical protein
MHGLDSRIASFLGVTAQVIGDDLQRQSFALACQRFPSPHTNDRIAKLLCKIFKEYKLNIDKITCCVTDNESNFVKAFNEYNVNAIQPDNDDEDIDNTQETLIGLHGLLDNIVLVQQPGQQPQNNEAECSVSSNEEESQSEEDPIALPNHQRCIAHTLHLIASNSPKAAAEASAKYRFLMHSTNGKLSAIWNKVNSPKSNETIEAVLGCQIVRPIVTRWNSYYDARKSLLSHSAEKLEQVCKDLKLPELKDTEIVFVKEDIQVSHL